MNEFENGFHNENLENNRINNQENNSQQVAIDVTPIEESVTQENTESHRYSYREQGTGGSSYQYDNGNNCNDTYNNSYSSHGWRDESTIIMKIIMGISRRNLIRDADRERMAVKIIRTEWVRKPPS